MIAGTNASCKIINKSVSQTTATITLLFFATASTIPAKSFRIAIKDSDTGLITYADNNVYWIDQMNNYENNTNNIDTKKYKEVMFDIDITNSNLSSIKGTRWVRNCYILLIDTSKRIDEKPAWASEPLELISDDFVVPEITYVTFESTNESLVDDELRSNIKAYFYLKYESERDFNYNNKNLDAYINVRSISSDKILEKKQIAMSLTKDEHYIETDNKYTVGYPVVVELVLTNIIGETLVDIRKIYTPEKKYSNTFIKTDDGYARAISFTVALDAEEEHEGEWL